MKNYLTRVTESTTISHLTPHLLSRPHPCLACFRAHLFTLYNLSTTVTFSTADPQKLAFFAFSDSFDNLLQAFPKHPQALIQSQTPIVSSVCFDSPLQTFILQSMSLGCTEILWLLLSLPTPLFPPRDARTSGNQHLPEGTAQTTVK